MRHFLTTSAIAALLAVSPALAAEQTAPKAEQTAPKMNDNSAQTGQTGEETPAPAGSEQNKAEPVPVPDEQKAEAPAPAASGEVAFVTDQAQNQWLTSKLVGRSVQNPQGEALGDINDVLIGENGEIAAVVIGVGGFLGIGEKAVGVEFGSLQFTAAPVTEAKAVDETAPAKKPQTGLAAPDQAPKSTDEAKTDLDKPKAGASGDQAVAADEGETVIVLNTSAKQLQDAPMFREFNAKAGTSTKPAPDAMKKPEGTNEAPATGEQKSN